MIKLEQSQSVSQNSLWLVILVNKTLKEVLNISPLKSRNTSKQVDKSSIG